MSKVKICGITNLEDALFCFHEGADALGFIFFKGSPRYINEKTAKKIIQKLGPFIVKVGVFVDEDKKKVLNIASSLGLDVLQFHGKETPAYCRFFKSRFKVIKVIFPDSDLWKQNLSLYDVDAFLFDVRYEDKLKGKKVLGDSSLKEIASFIKKGKKVIISGGLNIKNLGKVEKLKPYAFDVSSGVEESIGKKNRELVRSFIKKIKE